MAPRAHVSGAKGGLGVKKGNHDRPLAQVVCVEAEQGAVLSGWARKFVIQKSFLRAKEML